jgi:D-alanine-D-alanine ligase-like ATP-grasp enzyme
MEQFQKANEVNASRYPYLSQKIIEIYLNGDLDNVEEVLVEPSFGYVTKINYIDGSNRITKGNDIGVNLASSTHLAKDKGHTKLLLNAIGINTPEGRDYIMPWWADEISINYSENEKLPGHQIVDADEYITSVIKYPVYIKPVNGSLGRGIHKVFDSNELEELIEDYNSSRIKVAVIEKSIDYPDYRLVVMDEELIFANLRSPFSVVGDGESTIKDLIMKTREEYINLGREIKIKEDDPRIQINLDRQNLSIDNILNKYQILKLLNVSNLSAGGTSEEVKGDINDRWIDIASYIANNFGLRLIGLDIAIKDIHDYESDYSVIEVNSSPGFNHYAMSGHVQEKKVSDFIRRVINSIPE